MSAAGIQAERDMHENLQEIRRTHGEEAYLQAKASWRGSQIGMLGGAAKGAAVGTMLCPGLGTAVGAFLGMLVGGRQGAKDASASENGRTATGAMWDVAGAIAGNLKT